MSVFKKFKKFHIFRDQICGFENNETMIFCPVEEGKNSL